MIKLDMKMIFAGVVALGITSAAHAAPLMYDEAVDGDIEFDNLTLDFGANMISGTVSNPVGANADFDLFDAILPAGNVVLDSIQVVLSQNPDGNGSFPFTFNYFQNGDPLTEIDTSTGAPLDLLIGATLTSLEFVGLNSLPDGMAVDYKITINLSDPDADIPLPAAAPLFIAGLAGLGLWRRKRA